MTAVQKKDAFHEAVVKAAFDVLSAMNHPRWRGKVCVDLISDAYYDGETVEVAAERVVDDTLYWDGAFV